MNTWRHMRNLYARLSLPPTATTAEIKAAITACPHAELKTDAAAVLLHAGRRRAYDQLYATLITIGSLRASLGLVPTRLWQGQRDFDGEVKGSGSRYGEFIRKRDRLAAARRFENGPSKTAAPLTKLIEAMGTYFGAVSRKP